jgi:hypothetical protein
MRIGCDEVGMPPLARRAKVGVHQKPDADLLKAALRHVLANKAGINTSIGNRDDWVKLATRIPAYTNQYQMTKFILLAAAHDTAEDKLEPGLVVAAKGGVLPALEFDHWRGESTMTMEHIAPQSQEPSWSEEIYRDFENVERLGNLTLLPSIENTSLGNRPWAQKRLIYGVLSAPTADELDSHLAAAKAEGIEIGTSTAEILKRSRFLPHVKAISNVKGDWDVQMIDRRTVRIAELAWDRLSPWLGY